MFWNVFVEIPAWAGVTPANARRIHAETASSFLAVELPAKPLFVPTTASASFVNLQFLRWRTPFRQPRLNPPDPTSHVQSKPGGGTRLHWLLLVKPDGTCDEILDGILAPE